MANNMNVSLAVKDGVNVLDVDDKGGQNQLGKGTGAATISWNLNGALTQGNFVPMDQNPPGFEWAPPGPPSGVFGTPTIGANGNSVDITDNNSIAGEWIYVLRVNYNGAVIATQLTLLTGSIDNPVIINKGP